VSKAIHSANDSIQIRLGRTEFGFPLRILVELLALSAKSFDALRKENAAASLHTCAGCFNVRCYN
jgi:hypothetical protein